jgi:hypothetical protein
MRNRNCVLAVFSHVGGIAARLNGNHYRRDLARLRHCDRLWRPGIGHGGWLYGLGELHLQFRDAFVHIVPERR